MLGVKILKVIRYANPDDVKVKEYDGDAVNIDDFIENHRGYTLMVIKISGKTFGLIYKNDAQGKKESNIFTLPFNGGQLIYGTIYFIKINGHYIISLNDDDINMIYSQFIPN